MENVIPTYSLFEGSFITAAPVLDRSVNILMFRDPDDKEYNLLINRTLLDEDQTIDTFCETQIENLRNTLPGFQVEGKLLKNEIGPAKLVVIQLANRYLQDGKTIRQVQSVMKLPMHNQANPSGRGVIIFTLHVEDEFTEFQRKHYVQVLNSFNPEMSVSGR
ncbi:DcrB-related protein [Scandinavium goeteborgense]|uniref:DcrB-related protein n=1 Tax=Scandinavium goeteborgense TaxID=1851514 RepID=UPI00382D460A